MGAVFLVEEPPEFEFRGGMFYVTEKGTGTCYCFRPSTFLASIADAVGMSRACRIGKGAEIIRVDFDSKFERVGSDKSP